MLFANPFSVWMIWSQWVEAPQEHHPAPELRLLSRDPKGSVILLPRHMGVFSERIVWFKERIWTSSEDWERSWLSGEEQGCCSGLQILLVEQFLFLIGARGNKPE